MKTIYIFTHGTTLRKVGRRLILEKKGQKLFELPIKEVGRILIYAQVEITAQTVNGLVECNIPVIYARRSGSVKAKVVPATGNHVFLRRRQYQCCGDDTFALPLAKAIIHTKICNMAAVIAHVLRGQEGTAAACRPMEEACRNLMNCRTREEIMGTEGAAARHYFRVYGAALPDPFPFTVRSRRPAQDPANALLNLGYMTLLREIEGHLEIHDLDPYFGVLHVAEERRSSLALDLLEEFRQPLIDLFILRLLKLKELGPDHFQRSDEDGIRMTDDGLKLFFRKYEERLGKQDGDRPGLRKVIDDQVVSFRQHLLGEAVYHHLVLDNIETTGP